MEGDEQVKAVESNIKVYMNYNIAGTFFSVGLIVAVIQKLIFNLFSSIQMPIDKWTVIDLI